MRILFVGVLILSTSLHAQTVLTDAFNGSTVNSANWQTLLPFEDSSVTVGGGLVTLANRGGLLSQSSFDGAFSLAGTFTMNLDTEHFDIIAHTDGSIVPDNGYAERTGLHFTFINDADLIRIQEFNANGSNPDLGTVAYTLTTGQSYNFVATLDGPNVSLSINGVLLLTATSTYATGSQIGFYSREQSGDSTSLDSIAVSAIPEPGTIWLLGTGVLLLAFRRRAQMGGIKLK